MKPLDPGTSLTERVYGAILDDILDGVFALGKHLKQEQLAAELRVSRQPVQQAMALLKSDGLVEEIGTRGLRVTDLDLTRMQNHYDLRAVLDGFGARHAADRVQSGDLPAEIFMGQAQEILSAGTAAIASGSTRDQSRHDEAFHTLIYGFSGNSLLKSIAEPHWRFLRRAMAGVLRHAEPADAIWEQHAEIADAVGAGDAELAGGLAEAHATVASDLLSKALDTRRAQDSRGATRPV